MHLCTLKLPGDISRATKRPDKMLSERKGKFNFRCSCENGDTCVKRSTGGLSLLLFFSSLSFSSCHSCWQSLIVVDKLMKSNTGETTGTPFVQPAPARVYVSVNIPASVCVWPSHVLGRASESTRWWDSKRVMRSSSIPSGRGPFCRHEMVMNKPHTFDTLSCESCGGKGGGNETLMNK